MSKIAELSDILRGAHVMGDKPTYYDAKAARDAMRKRDFFEAFDLIRRALKNYRVTVSHDAQSVIRVYRADTGATVFLPFKR